MIDLDILVFAAHPDDAELGCGGMIASMIKQGYKVGIVDLTEGEMGSRGTIQSRYEEAKVSSEILGLHYRNNLQIADSIIENNRTNQKKIIQEIQNTRPDICFIGAHQIGIQTMVKRQNFVRMPYFTLALLKLKLVR